MTVNPMQNFNSIYGSNPAQAYSAQGLAGNTLPVSVELTEDMSKTLQAASQSDSWNWFNSAFGGTDSKGNFNQGWASPAIGAVGTLASSWLGFQQLGVAKDQLGMQREAWNLQKEEFEYQRNRRDAEEAAYAEVRKNQNKNHL